MIEASNFLCACGQFANGILMVEEGTDFVPVHICNDCLARLEERREVVHVSSQEELTAAQNDAKLVIPGDEV